MHARLSSSSPSYSDQDSQPRQWSSHISYLNQDSPLIWTVSQVCLEACSLGITPALKVKTELKSDFSAPPPASETFWGSCCVSTEQSVVRDFILLNVSCFRRPGDETGFGTWRFLFLPQVTPEHASCTEWSLSDTTVTRKGLLASTWELAASWLKSTQV